MLGKYEKRVFHRGEKVWLGRYRGLTNILHWHSECELIRIESGTAQIRIGNALLQANAGECVFCGAEELHYIIGSADSLIDVMIFHKDLLREITESYKPAAPLLQNGAQLGAALKEMRRTTEQPPRFFRRTQENAACRILLDIFNENPLVPHQPSTADGRRIIDKLNRDFATVGFREMAAFSGYSPAHFSKLFKRLTGMTFSDYLNHVKTEHAVSLLQQRPELTVTEVSARCGFTTIRNFNRVFKSITGYTPGSLPACFSTAASAGIREPGFDPTDHSSILL